MGWFNKKQNVAQQPLQQQGGMPELPSLPDLPDLPELNFNDKKESLPQLPSFPNSSFGEKFSQNTIKDAIKGKPQKTFDYTPEEKIGEGFSRANEFAPKKMQMMPKTQKFRFQKPERTREVEEEFEFPSTKEIKGQEEFNFEDISLESNPNKDFSFTQTPTKDFREEKDYYEKKEPVYIRVDKFEEALKTFEKTKKEIIEIEKILSDITQVREDEDRELENWQKDVLKIKEQIEKVDQDIFSRVE